MPLKVEPVPTHSILSPCFLATGLCSVSPDPSPHHSSLHLSILWIWSKTLVVSPTLPRIDPVHCSNSDHFRAFFNDQVVLHHSRIIPDKLLYLFWFPLKKEAMLRVYLNYLLHVTERLSKSLQAGIQNGHHFSCMIVSYTSSPSSPTPRVQYPMGSPQLSHIQFISVSQMVLLFQLWVKTASFLIPSETSFVNHLIPVFL